MNLIKKILAGIFYTTGISFALLIIGILIKGNSMFDASSLIVSTMAVCIPIALATFILISAMDESGKRLKIMKTFILIIFVFYIILLINILFYNGLRHFTAPDMQYFKWNVNIIPFKTVGMYIRAFINDSMNKPIIIYNLLGNILLFAPMGIFLPCIFQGLRKFYKFIVFMLIILIGIEVMQVLTRSGSCDIDDVILNLVGAVFFYGLWNVNVVQRVLTKMYVIENV